MFIELSEYLLNIIEASNGIFSVIIMMIFIPLLFLLRTIAVLGLLYPYYSGMKNLFFIPSKTLESLLSMFCWTFVNIFILMSSFMEYFWIWGDIVGITIISYIIIQLQLQPNNSYYYKQFNKQHPRLRRTQY